MYLNEIVEIENINKEIVKLTKKIKKKNDKRAVQLNRDLDMVAIRNLMGRFSMYYSAGRYTELIDFFTKSDAAYLQRSDVGIFEGRESVKAYFDQLQADAVPGSFRLMNLSSEIIDVADDGQTAQGTWFLMGAEAIKDPANPDTPATDMWMYDKLAVEFLLEEGKWVILRYTHCEEVRMLYHLSWGEYAENPSYPEFDVFAKPDRAATNHNPFRVGRPSMKNLTTPEPYGSYSDLEDHF